MSLALVSPKGRRIDRLLCRLTWRRMHGAQRRLGFIASVLAWPVVASALAARLVKERGPALRAERGVSLLRQYVDQLALALNYGRPPHTYYMYGFHQPTTRQHAGDYITPQEFRSVVDASLEPATELLFRDKFRFEQACQAHGLATAATLFMVSDGRVTTVDGDPVSALPEEDLFIKLAAGLGGKDAELWRWEAPHYCGRGGARLTPDALLQRFSQQSRGKHLLAQRRLQNHRALVEHLGVAGLATVRIITGRSRTGAVALLCAVFKAPRLGSIVDNLSSGSIGCPIDPSAGTLRAGYTMASPNPLPVHPDTGAQFDGFELPGWPAARDLARQAHHAFVGLAFAGWDIALTDDGPVIVEGNTFPNVESMQQAHGPLLQSQPFLALCMEQADGAAHPGGTQV